ncbi:hypothetical protein [Bacillus sp. UNC438CL73TsuS30]|uniref:hypothetical protein n=1 Tax=Bacillus sp. UNC438CL73TsuS30 TaxID=1340434 RepID=UPI000A9F5139|nr:hypothetical protein [Bacillus sp. UNC438CL73TsuS30]
MKEQNEKKNMQEKVLEMLNELGLNAVPGQPHLKRKDASLIMDMNKNDKEIVLRA